MNPSKLKIVTRKEAEVLVRKWKQDGQRVVFTNGCFDILHLGHIDYLEKARNLGDRLIVGLNTDDSVIRLKGPGRPIQDELARARMLAALSFVDAVIKFEEDTPKELISFLVPDVLVKGGDYDMGNIVGADIVMENGGQVETIDLVEGHSTSDIIDRIQKSGS